ncbi:SDR family oxidoreductase [Carboxylicivirga sp. M1479]|uniref:SDR family oxidoreductase n=1 Tax=Carboxylicivirga sp. M1479 TaxID=2594476 RepID=UPI00117898F3|nr:SDR family oxidoreductase [Carboxylicivirga sp. M1479]TRX70767.1 SDR family oxidoreductase [Carboxylicivirga sp. M1479]
MKVLLTGATGYIGKRLLPLLIQKRHHIVCLVRDKDRFHIPSSFQSSITVIEGDLTTFESLNSIPEDIDAAYYLVHSMSSASNYQSLELKSALNFRKKADHIGIKQVVYLSGIINEYKLSPHLQSRKDVELELNKGTFALTCLRAGIIIGAGSASFEIIRDLVEKLPVMITPKWLNTKCQPIGIYDVINILIKSLGNPQMLNTNFDIGGPDALSYKEMLLKFAFVRQLKRYIYVAPVMTPRLSSYWLYFITSTSYKLATALVDSMKIEVICRDNRINQLLEIEPVSYVESLKSAFSEIKDEKILSSWRDALIVSNHDFKLSDFIMVPTYGCFIDKRIINVSKPNVTLEKIWRIGGFTGWHFANWLWQLRGFIDRLNKGVGLRRGRTHRTKIESGDVIDFWRVVYANKDEGRLLLYAEMKLPGEAWLEFNLDGRQLTQTATFRPKGLLGRLYWFAVLPFHHYIFNGMLKQLA